MKSAPSLFRLVRSRRNLLRAWEHVESRASGTNDADTKKALARFRENPGKETATICTQLGKGTFNFLRQKGYTKRRKGKTPRPIVVAPIVNRVVQRSILDICQSKDRKIRQSLGNLPDVIDCATSVGGLPNRGVQNAISLIRQAVSAGARWYVRSDLVEFFTRIPKPDIEKYLRANISDAAFVALFMQALATELENEADVRDEIGLFPMDERGVPQGSALSALCANIILSDFDKRLNGRGITTIRYLDDFVILAKSKKSLDKTWTIALSLLKDVGLTAHDPKGSSGKASQGEISAGFDFLSFHINDRVITPSDSARRDFMRSIDEVIKKAKTEIDRAGKEPRRNQPRFVQTLTLLDQKIRGWGDAFRSSSDRLAMAQMDSEIQVRIQKFMSWFQRHTKALDGRERMRRMGIALLIDTPREPLP